MQTDVILFDWGGTLAEVTVQNAKFTQWATEAGRLVVGSNSQSAIDVLVARVLDSDRIASADPELREADLGCYFCDWAASIGHKVQPDLRARVVEMLNQIWIGSLEALPGAVDTLKKLRERGYRMGLVSNCMLPTHCCRAELQRQGLLPWLDFTVFSGEVGYRKPAPVIYQTALREAFQGAPRSDLSRVMFVGDSPKFDCLAPSRLGMKTALIAKRTGIWSEADYEGVNPTLTMDSIAELPDLLCRG